jgi:hypothetical protein
MREYDISVDGVDFNVEVERFIKDGCPIYHLKIFTVNKDESIVSNGSLYYNPILNTMTKDVTGIDQQLQTLITQSILRFQDDITSARVR